MPGAKFSDFFELQDTTGTVLRKRIFMKIGNG
jgi:hypothetical protein